ncbi:MAG: hypothetical protein JST30_07985 [Armatimonadetes bacterium]|nr:hypothetical protein [Armatimonadota bacterium]
MKRKLTSLAVTAGLVGAIFIPSVALGQSVRAASANARFVNPSMVRSVSPVAVDSRNWYWGGGNVEYTVYYVFRNGRVYPVVQERRLPDTWTYWP